MLRRFPIQYDQNYLVSSSNINLKEKVLRNFSTYWPRARILDKGIMREMEWRISKYSSRNRFPWALMLKHSSDFSFKFPSAWKGQQGLLEILCGSEFGFDILIFHHFSSSSPKVTSFFFFLDGEVDSPCPKSLPVSLLSTGVGWDPFYFMTCFQWMINFSFFSWFKEVRQESSHLTFVAFTPGALLLRLPEAAPLPD